MSLTDLISDHKHLPRCYGKYTASSTAKSLNFIRCRTEAREPPHGAVGPWTRCRAVVFFLTAPIEVGNCNTVCLRIDDKALTTEKEGTQRVTSLHRWSLVHVIRTKQGTNRGAFATKYHKSPRYGNPMSIR